MTKAFALNLSMKALFFISQSSLQRQNMCVCERILPLNAQRFENGDLPLVNLLAKYCSYLRIN